MTGRPSLTLLVALSAGWSLTLALAPPGWLMEALSIYALVTLGILARVWRPGLALLRPRGRDLGLGAAGAAILLTATYVGYGILEALWPPLRALTLELVALSRVDALTAVLLAGIVLAEEVIWRGALLDRLRAEASVPLAVLGSSLVYALAQFGTGSWLVALLALCLGVLWAALRLWTGGLIAPLMVHLAWTYSVVVIAPPVRAP